MSQSETIKEFADKIRRNTISKVDEVDRYGIDPITIIMCISILVGIIRIIQECNKSKMKQFGFEDRVELIGTEVRFRAQNHSFITRRRINKIIKTHLNTQQYKVYGDAMLKTMLEEGVNVTDDKIQALMEYKQNV